MKPIAVVVLAIVFVLGVQAQTDQKFETHRKQALTLYDLGRHTEALPLISDLLKQRPNDVVLLERYAMCLIAQAAGEQDPEKRKQLRAEAKKNFNRSKELGNNSQLVAIADDIPDDGSFSAFSDKKEVDAAIQAGEAAFAKGDLDAAIANYEQAALLDPKNYEAPLFIGDMYLIVSK